METSIKSDEVMQTNTLTPYNLPNIQDIKKEMCDEDLTSRLDKYDDFDFEPFHENIFRTLSAHFDNNSSINEVDDACLKLENCFIENNILDKNGLTKSTLKGSPNSYIFLKYRDIDDAFVDMVISESVGKFNKSPKCPPKKIDLKHFKDNFFSINLNDFEDPQSQCSESDSEAIGESESFIEPSQSEIDVSDGYTSDIESTFTEDTDLLVPDNLVNSGYTRHVRSAKLSNSKTTDSNNQSLIASNPSPFKGTVGDVRVMVEKLRYNNEEHNFIPELSSQKSHGSKFRQVARKKTGGMVINTNMSESSDAESNKELSNQLSKDGEMSTDGFDKMTRSDRRRLEKIIAESRANLASRSGELISENNKGSKSNKLDNLSNEKESDTISSGKESDSTNERDSASTSNEKESDNTLNEKELDGTSNEDKLKENELLKSAVKNTILDFLTKSKGLKLGKEKVDLISDEITKKLNSFIPDEDGTDADDQAISNSGISTDVNKLEDNEAVKNIENNEENSSKKGVQENVRSNSPKKRTTRRNATSANARKRLQEFQEIARDIINCKLSTPLVDDLEESLKTNTLKSLAKDDEVHVDDSVEEPRRRITRLSVTKNDKDKILAGDEHEEPRKPTTRQSNGKINADGLVEDDVHQEPRRPITRKSLSKTDKDILPNELPKEAERQSNTTSTSSISSLPNELPKEPKRQLNTTTTSSISSLPNELPKEPKRQSNTTTTPCISSPKNDKDIILLRDEQDETKRRTTRQSIINSDTNVVPDDGIDEEPRRPATRKFSAKNDKNIIIIDLDKEEPKKSVVRKKTVAQMERSSTLGPILSPLDGEIEEPTRRTTRQSLQKQKDISKESPECIELTNELKPLTIASKRKSNPKTKKTTAKKWGKKQKGHNKKELQAILRDNNLINANINDDSIISLSDSDASKSSKILDSSIFSDRTILKASADSTTSETEPNEEIASSRLADDTEKPHLPPTNTSPESDVIRVTEKASSLSLHTEITSDIHINSEKNGDEVHSQSENNQNYSIDNGLCLPDTSISVGSLKNQLNNLANSDTNHSSDTSDDNLKNVSKLVEDVLDESMKEKLSQNQEPSEGSPFKKSFSTILFPFKDKKAPQPVDEPFQILNDMITDIEERLLKEESEATMDKTENDLNKDINTSATPDNDFFNSPTVTMEISADSTSFLNYTMDDSFKLMIDESTPQKENTVKERDSSKRLSIGSKENEEKNIGNKLNTETSVVLSNSSELSSLKEYLNKEAINSSKKEVEKSHIEITLKEDNDKDATKSKEEVEVSDVEEVLNTCTKKEFEKLLMKEKELEKNEDNFTEERTNEKDKPSSAANGASIDQKLSSSSFFFFKPLTNEEKIAQLTKRDPRLVNEKKITTNVVIRDPRLRNKLPKIDEKRENVPSSHNTSVSKLNEHKLNISDKLEPNIPESLHKEPKQLESKNTEEQKKPSDLKPFEQQIVVSKISEPKILSSLPEVKTIPSLMDIVATSRDSEVKSLIPTKKSIRPEVLDNDSDHNRKKRAKKTIDKELLYKTPLSDLHDMHAERSTYERDRDFKKKKLFPEGRTVRIITEERSRTLSAPRRIRSVDEPSEERRDYNQSVVVSNSQSLFRRDSQEEQNFARPNVEEVSRADHRYLEEVRFREENLTYEEKTFYKEDREQVFQSGSSENYEQGSYIRRMVTETSYSETIHKRNDFQDNHIYSRREFYRRNRHTHDHDHLGNSSRLLGNSNTIRQENELYPQHNNFPVVEPAFNVSSYPPISSLPEPMYSQEEDLDQSYGNMETESFSPPSSDLCPPPPLIRSPTPELGRRDNYCPSPPRIGRRESNDERDYDKFSRSYRNYDNDDRGFRGRNNSGRGQRGGNFRRGNGREFHRWREDSPPRKRFAGEHFRGRDDDRGRWRRSPSWSPERPRRWSRERSPPLPPPPPPRELHPWNSPREIHPWDSPPRVQQHPWNSPPRNRSPSPPRRRDNFRDNRDRTSYYHRY